MKWSTSSSFVVVFGRQHRFSHFCFHIFPPKVIVDDDVVVVAADVDDVGVVAGVRLVLCCVATVMNENEQHATLQSRRATLSFSLCVCLCFAFSSCFHPYTCLGVNITSFSFSNVCLFTFLIPHFCLSPNCPSD